MPAPSLPNGFITLECCSDSHESRIRDVVCKRHRTDGSNKSGCDRVLAQGDDVTEDQFENTAGDEYRKSCRRKVECDNPWFTTESQRGKKRFNGAHKHCGRTSVEQQNQENKRIRDGNL